MGMFPQNLGALRVAPADAVGWAGPYMDKDIPPDPWGNQYMYQCPGQYGEYDIVSPVPTDRSAPPTTSPVGNSDPACPRNDVELRSVRSRPAAGAGGSR